MIRQTGYYSPLVPSLFSPDSGHSFILLLHPGLIKGTSYILFYISPSSSAPTPGPPQGRPKGE